MTDTLSSKQPNKKKKPDDFSFDRDLLFLKSDSLSKNHALDYEALARQLSERTGTTLSSALIKQRLQLLDQEHNIPSQPVTSPISDSPQKRKSEDSAAPNGLSSPKAINGKPGTSIKKARKGKATPVKKTRSGDLHVEPQNSKESPSSRRSQRQAHQDMSKGPKGIPQLDFEYDEEDDEEMPIYGARKYHWG